MTVQNREILDALLDIFAERGCFATNLDAVAATAGIGKGSLYRQFESREALCRAALDHGARRLAARCRQIWDAHGDAATPGARLLAVVTDLMTLDARGDPLSPNALLRLSCSNRWTGRDQRAPALTSAFVPLVQGWQAAGALNAQEDPHWIAGVLLGLVSSLPLTGASPEEPEPVVARVAALLQRAFPPS
jgi:AcrR family transcriptional regulator